jgi:hypothetical protein
MAYDDDDILQKQQSHPITTTLLLVTTLALVGGIWLSVKQLGQYVNPEVRRMTSEYTVKPIEIDRRQFPDVGEADEQEPDA